MNNSINSKWNLHHDLSKRHEQLEHLDSTEQLPEEVIEMIEQSQEDVRLGRLRPLTDLSKD